MICAAVQVRTHRIQFLLGGQTARSATPAARTLCAVGPPWPALRVVQSERVRTCSRLQLVAGVPDVSAHRRIGPRPSRRCFGVAVEPKVQLHQLGHRLDLFGGEPQLLHPLAPQAWPRPHRDDGTTPCRPARTGGSGACRHRAAAPPAGRSGPAARTQLESPAAAAGTPARSPAPARSGCAGRRPCAGGVRRAPAAAPAAPAAPDRPDRWTPAGPVRPGAIGEQQPSQLVPYPFRRDDADPLRHVGHRRTTTSGAGREVELRGEPGRAHHP